MTERQQADVIVIGLGPGGEHAAGRLAEVGLDVVGIEAELVGGECPYWGCVPSKMMIRAGNLLAEARRIPSIAGTSQITPDWAPVAARIRDEATDDWNDQVAVDRLTSKGGRFIRGRARLTGPHQVAVNDHELTARRGIVIATGTRPTAPPIAGLADVPYWTNRDAIAAKELAGSLIVLGGGAIGLELAQVFARFGVTVTVVEALDRLLPVEEPETGHLISEVLQREGISIRTGARAIRAEHDGVTFTLQLDGGELLLAERLLVATGRRADLTGLGLDATGLDPTARAITTDRQMRAGEGLWAIGDVTGHGAFTHVAMYEAEIAVRNILGEPGPDADYRALPRVTFTDPEIGAVGLTEQQARDAGLRVRTGTAHLPSSARGWIHKASNQGLVKLVEDADRRVLVGATTAGPAGGEMLYGLALAIHAEVPTERLRHMIYAYPTFHRAVETALADLH